MLPPMHLHRPSAPSFKKTPPPLRRIGRVATLVAALSLISAPVQAFSVDVHRWLTEQALRGVVPIGPLMTPTEEQYMQWWLWFGRAMASPSGSAELDGSDPKRFASRYPGPRSFDAFAIRGFLGLSQEPTPAVMGLDDYDREGEIDRFNLVVRGSAQPDVDRRNQERFAYDAKRLPLKTADGRRVPADPAALNMGGPTGLDSQAHAHYQLATEKPSDDPEILQTEPWNFAVALGFDGPVETSAAEMAQAHLDMAIVMRAWVDEQQGVVSDYLPILWASAGLHYVQDAAGPLHNVQVGSYDVFKRAKLMWYLQGLKTAGGYLGDLPTFMSIGVDLLGNLHLFSEAWMARELDQLRLGKPGVKPLQAVWAAPDKPDSELIKALGQKLDPHLADPFKVQPWQDGQGAATILVHTLARLGSRDGAAIYKAALDLADGEVLQVGYRLSDKMPLQAKHLASGEAAEQAAAQMGELHARSLARAMTATRLYWRAYEQGNDDTAARRLRRFSLNRLEKEAVRQKAWMAAAPKNALKAEQRPEFAAGLAVAATLLSGLTVWWLRRRKGNA